MADESSVKRLLVKSYTLDEETIDLLEQEARARSISRSGLLRLLVRMCAEGKLEIPGKVPGRGP